MKYTFLFAATLLVACGAPTKREQAILDYEQTTNGVKTDLSMKILKLEKLHDTTGPDSASILTEEILGRPMSLDELKQEYDRYDSIVAGLDSLVNKYDKLYQDESIKARKNYELLSVYNDARTNFKIKKVEPEIHLSKLESMISVVAELRERNWVLNSTYRCTYKIKNPLLNNAEQEITKNYVFSPAGAIVNSYQ